MPAALFDTNVWLAAIFPTHIFHEQARQLLRKATPDSPAAFCRSTEQSLLRIASTPAILRSYGAEGLTNRDALVALHALLALPQVCEVDEPAGVAALWHQLAVRDTASPKVWMDAYLAAFAISGGLRFVTFDGGFEQFDGLDLLLLPS